MSTPGGLCCTRLGSQLSGESGVELVYSTFGGFGSSWGQTKLGGDIRHLASPVPWQPAGPRLPLAAAVWVLPALFVLSKAGAGGWRRGGGQLTSNLNKAASRERGERGPFLKAPCCGHAASRRRVYRTRPLYKPEGKPGIRQPGRLGLPGMNTWLQVSPQMPPTYEPGHRCAQHTERGSRLLCSYPQAASTTR